MPKLEFSPVENPTIYVSERVAEQAITIGAVAFASDRAGVDGVVKLATGSQVIHNLGGLVLRPASEPYLLAAPTRYFHAPADTPLEEVLNGKPYAHEHILKAAEQQDITLLNIYNRKPTEKRVSRGLYGAAARWTTRGQSFISSQNDKIIGGLMGTALGLALDSIDNGVFDTETLAELISVQGMLADFWEVGAFSSGAVVLTPMLAELRKTIDLRRSQVRENPPIHISMSPFDIA